MTKRRAQYPAGLVAIALLLHWPYTVCMKKANPRLLTAGLTVVLAVIAAASVAAMPLGRMPGNILWLVACAASIATAGLGAAGLGHLRRVLESASALSSYIDAADRSIIDLAGLLGNERERLDFLKGQNALFALVNDDIA